MDKIMTGRTSIVTGASSGIGLAISRVLCEMGYVVYGFGRDFSGVDEDLAANELFCPIVCDLLDTEAMLSHIRQIKSRHEVSLLVNNAGVGYYGLHEELNPKKIQVMMRTNLEVPIILANQLLRQLKRNRGYMINISSITASASNPHGCAYGAAKAGLAGFSRSLFDEARKYGVKVVNIQPDMTKTNLYRNADFKEGQEEASYLLPDEVAEAVRYVLNQRDGMVVTELSLRPQIHRIQRKRV